MNLLTDPWVPVRKGKRFQHVTFGHILCTDEAWDLSLPRDDLELAALQLLVCLTQVLFLPKDREALSVAERSPMSEADFGTGIAPRMDKFRLDHTDAPFMQSRHVAASEPTPIQKLFAGLPEGNNHALFNGVGEISQVCSSCAAIALFNQAANCPSFGGGFKGSLRGSAPVTTLLQGDNLRRTIWRNVLSQRAAGAVSSVPLASDTPVWVVPVRKSQSIAAADIGLQRGLFWQPTRVELIPGPNGASRCDCCGVSCDRSYTGFNKEKFTFTVVGLWPHPHSPRLWQKERASMVVTSFRGEAPQWTQLTEYIVEREEADKEGYLPAAVVLQHRDVWPGDMRLIVGGYRNKQAAIIDRKHEMIGLRAGWDEHLDELQALVDLAIQIKTGLRGKAYGFGKEVGVVGLATQAERLFYQRTEPLIHRALQEMDFDRLLEALALMARNLTRTAKDILEEVARPYAGMPKGIRALATARRTLGAALTKIAGAFEGESS